jgi:hypothetical protein
VLKEVTVEIIMPETQQQYTDLKKTGITYTLLVLDVRDAPEDDL